MTYKKEMLDGAIQFSIRCDKLCFAIGVQSFLLDYEPEDQAEFNFIVDMLTKAIVRANQIDPAKWTVQHNGQKVECDSISEMIRASQGMRTEAESLLAAQRLKAAIDADIAEEANAKSK